MDISVTGPKIYFRITIGSVKIDITQTIITLTAVTILLVIGAFFLGRKLTKRPGKRQVIAEKIVSMLYGMVEETMGKHNLKYAPYIGTIFASSLCCTLIGLTGVFKSATADISVTLAWALVTSVLVWRESIKANGFLGWLKGFAQPVLMTPMNIVSEIAQPVALAFRHFGNVAGGGVLTTLIYSALAALSSALFSWLPGVLGTIPYLQAGIPAVLSLYFDFFSGFVQALVFSLLTMVYVASAIPVPEGAEAE